MRFPPFFDWNPSANNTDKALTWISFFFSSFFICSNDLLFFCFVWMTALFLSDAHLKGMWVLFEFGNWINFVVLWYKIQISNDASCSNRARRPCPFPWIIQQQATGLFRLEKRSTATCWEPIFVFDRFLSACLLFNWFLERYNPINIYKFPSYKRLLRHHILCWLALLSIILWVQSTEGLAQGSVPGVFAKMRIGRALDIVIAVIIRRAPNSFPM